MNVGAQVGGRYSVVSVAGSGGMCSVFRAVDPDGKPVAIKALHHRAGDAEERFAREVSLLQELRHPAIVRYLDSGIDDNGERFLVMEWLEGHDLEHVLRNRILTIAEVLGLVGRIAHALSAAHVRGIVHRDVKPSNIFVSGDDMSTAKLLDFGVARWGRGLRATRTGTSLGTPAYMAPEQVRGERVIDSRADVFALGCVMHECLTGEPAFVAHNPMAVFCKILVDRAPTASELVTGLPEPLDHLLKRMLAKEAVDRPRDAAVVAQALDSILAGLETGVGELKPSRTPVPSRPKKTITQDEQRLVNVIVASAGTAPASTGEARTVNLAPAKLPAVEFSQRVNVRFDALGDGSLIALLEAGGVATDQAMNAARFALALRDEFPGGTLALSTGLAVLGKTKLVGEAIDRACILLAADLGFGGDRPLPRPIRLDAVTANLIGARFEVSHDEHGPFLVGPRPAAALERTLLGKPTPFVGRARELGALSATLEESIELGVARAVLVTGQAGSGKSRLLREFLGKVAARGDVEVWTAHGDPIHSASALDMMSMAIRQLAGVVEDEPAWVRRQKVSELVARHVTTGQVPRVTDFLSELLRVPAGSTDNVPLRAARQDPMLMNDQVRRAVDDLLDAHTRDHPVLLVLEDLHWGDQATITLVDRALRNLAERRLMIVALARPELREQAPRLWSGHNMIELLLGPLPRRAAHLLADAVLGSDVPAQRVAELVERADGNPFYLEELLRTAASGHFILPETVLAMMQARIEALEPEARRVLRAASVFGASFWRGGVATLLGGVGELDRWLEALVERELISPAENSKFSEERSFRFRHEIVRDASYSLLVADDRKLGHRLAGEWLERVGETDAFALAEHFERGEVMERALPLYSRAAENALERGDFGAVLSLCQRATRAGADGVARGQLGALEGGAHYWRGEHALAERACLQAMELLPRGKRRWYQSVGYLMIVWSASEARDKMEALGRTLLEVAPDADPRGRTVALATAAWRLSLAGSAALAGDLLSACDASVAEPDRASGVIAAHLHRARAARALMRDGDPGTFVEEMERAAACFDEIGDARESCFQRGNVGYGLSGLGRAEEAEQVLRATVATAERMGLDHVANAARSNLGIPLARLGRSREAVTLLQRAATFFEGHEDRRFAGGARLYTALIQLNDGEAEHAVESARAAIAHLSPGTQARALSVLARALLSLGRTDEAYGHADTARRQLAGVAMFDGDASVWLAWAEVLSATGREAEAKETIATARERLLARAARISRPEWRQSFLEDVADHARTLALAESWGG